VAGRFLSPKTKSTYEFPGSVVAEVNHNNADWAYTVGAPGQFDGSKPDQLSRGVTVAFEEEASAVLAGTEATSLNLKCDKSGDGCSQDEPDL